MRHKKHKYKLTMERSHRQLLIKNLACELIDHKSITTTLIKCKALRPYVEKLITIAKEDNLASRRLAYTKVNNRNAVQELFKNVAPKFANRNGGYTRIVRMADQRHGDGATLASISLVD